MSTLRGITLMIDVKITQNISAQRQIILEDYLTTHWTFPVDPRPLGLSRFSQWLFEDTRFNQS